MAQEQGHLIGLLIREGQIVILEKEPWYINIHRKEGSCFKKTTDEKLKVSAIRSSHKRALRRLGLNPKKVFNDSRIPI